MGVADAPRCSGILVSQILLNAILGGFKFRPPFALGQL
jgi:hypothetical protein